MDSELKYLGKQSPDAIETLDRIPWKGERAMIELQCDEFTTHCPVTGQPDFGTLQFYYAPGAWLVETKSLKLFLWGYRHVARFNEELCNDIIDKFFAQIEPAYVRIDGQFNTRGGIRVHCSVTRGCVHPDHDHDDGME